MAHHLPYAPESPAGMPSRPNKQKALWAHIFPQGFTSPENLRKDFFIFPHFHDTCLQPGDEGINLLVSFISSRTSPNYTPDLQHTIAACLSYIIKELAFPRSNPSYEKGRRMIFRTAGAQSGLASCFRACLLPHQLLEFSFFGPRPCPFGHAENAEVVVDNPCYDSGNKGCRNRGYSANDCDPNGWVHSSHLWLTKRN